MSENRRYTLLVVLAFLGVLFAALAGLADKYPWLHSLCAGFGDGCRDAVRYTLWTIPLWVYGAVFYVFLSIGCLIGRLRPVVPWLVAALVGVEVTLVQIMVAQRLLCIYCLGNMGVVLVMIAVTINRNRIWQTLAVGLAFFVLASHLLPGSTGIPSAAAGKGNGNTPAAKVGDQEITMGQLEGPLMAQIYEMEREIYQLKRRRLDELIAEALIQKEAAARQITVSDLLNQEVLSKGVTVTDEEVNQYYLENRPRFTEWKGSLDDLKSRIRATLQQQKQYKMVYEYARSLDKKYGVEDYLKAPPSPFANISIEGSPSLGPPDAPVVVLEFSDYECPSCRQAHEDVKKIRDLFAGRIRWVFKDYPLKRHEHAEKAAEAAHCAADQNKFWEYQDLLYGSQDPLTVEKMEELAKGLGMAQDQFKQCLEGGKYESIVDKEIENAKEAGVDRTPTFIVNGRMVTGSIGFDRFKQLIDEELMRQKGKP